jgi:hypothetical protein
MNRPIAGFFAFSAFISLGVVAPACGGDDTSPTGGGGTGGSGGATTGTSGTGGGKAGSGGTGGATGGTGGTGGSAGKAGGAPDAGGMTITCGTKMCGPIELPMFGLAPPCCPAGEMNGCGVSLMGFLCVSTTPGTPDPNCPAVTLPIPGAPPAPGCCSAAGVCGAELGAPLGCGDLSILTGMPATPCGGDAAPPMRDSGPDMSPPPPDTGTGDTGGGDTGGNDGTAPDSTPGDAPSTDGGGSDGGSDSSSDASGDRAG